MAIVYCATTLLIWFILYIIVLKVGLFLEDLVHRESIKKWKTDIQDYQHNRFKIKLYVTLFFVGIPLLWCIGLIQHIR